MVSGGEVDEPEFIKIIEDQGGLVVYDDYCFGSRYYEELVSQVGDPLTEITKRYVLRVPCARFKGGFMTRYNNLQRAKKEYGADGVIFQRMAFCTPHSGLALDFSVQAKKDENSMPMLFMDREYLGGGTGQVKARVQAFIERIESSKGEGRL
jgi:benzoyl-CoA reductase subunit C